MMDTPQWAAFRLFTLLVFSGIMKKCPPVMLPSSQGHTSSELESLLFRKDSSHTLMPED
ncbi:hypothetical protein D3C73_1616580 [compost metagenome]